jgi:hypothetical protein
MKGVNLSVVAATLLLAACDNTPTALTRPTPPTTSRAALVANNRVEVNTIALSDCGTEDVLVTGSFHQVLTITVDNAGGFHVNDHLDFTGLQGVGVVTGTQYVAHQTQMINFNVSKDLIGAEVTQPLVFTLIGSGSAPDEVFVAIQHFTINANGELTSFVDNFRVKCS